MYIILMLGSYSAVSDKFVLAIQLSLQAVHKFLSHDSQKLRELAALRMSLCFVLSLSLYALVNPSHMIKHPKTPICLTSGGVLVSYVLESCSLA